MILLRCLPLVAIGTLSVLLMLQHVEPFRLSLVTGKVTYEDGPRSQPGNKVYFHCLNHRLMARPPRLPSVLGRYFKRCNYRKYADGLCSANKRPWYA
jgi:hypothetical protein